MHRLASSESVLDVQSFSLSSIKRQAVNNITGSHRAGKIEISSMENIHSQQFASINIDAEAAAFEQVTTF